MIDVLLGSPADRRLLPAGRMAAPTPWIIAIMMFVMMIVAAAGLALAGSARVVSDGIAHRHSIQIADGSRLAQAALAAAQHAPGVVSATQVPEQELRNTLERWLGPLAREQADLPLPVLIDLQLAPDAEPEAVANAVRQAVPSAQMVSHSARLGPLLVVLKSLAWIAASIVALIALATAAAVVLATRSAIAAHRPTIDVMHGIGATDQQVTLLFQRRIAVDALAGGIGGGLIAAIVLAAVSSGGLAGAGQWTSGGLLGIRDLLILAVLPFIGAALATIVARRTVLKALRSEL